MASNNYQVQYERPPSRGLVKVAWLEECRPIVWVPAAVFLIALAIVVGVRWKNPTVHYTYAKRLDTIESYEAFLKRFPQSPEAASARERLLALKDEGAWKAATESGQPEDYYAYLHHYSKGVHRDQAERWLEDKARDVWFDLGLSPSIKELSDFLRRFPDSSYSRTARQQIELLNREQDLWTAASNSGNAAADLFRYLQQFPNGAHAKEARTALDRQAELDWTRVCAVGTELAFRAYIIAYPESPHVSEAQQRVAVSEQARARASIVQAVPGRIPPPPVPATPQLTGDPIHDRIARMAAGSTSELPTGRMISRHQWGDIANLRVENQTGYQLTLLFSGPESKEFVIPVGFTQSIQIKAGRYRMAASVPSPIVQNMVGQREYEPADYSVRYYISSSFSPSLN